MPRTLSAPEINEFRDRLVDAAAGLFTEHGRDGVSMRSLATELGVSPMTPYRYFKDKGDILAAVRTRAFDRFSERLEQAFALPGTAAERAARASDAYVAFAFEEPQSYRLMFDLSQPDENRYPELVRATARSRKTMTAHVEAFIAEGALEGDPVLIGHVFWAALHGAVVLELAGKLTPECDFAGVRTASAQALFRGFAPRRKG